MVESQQSLYVIMENSEPNSICDKSDSTESLTDASDNIENPSDIGITNKAFVGEDELDVKKSKPQQSSSSRVEDIVIVSSISACLKCFTFSFFIELRHRW